jgi:hypothetical protein
MSRCPGCNDERGCWCVDIDCDVSCELCLDFAFLERNQPPQAPYVRYTTRDSFPNIVAEWCAWPPEGA